MKKSGREVLLAAATLLEMQAALRLLPGGTALAPALEGAGVFFEEAVTSADSRRVETAACVLSGSESLPLAGASPGTGKRDAPSALPFLPGLFLPGGTVRLLICGVGPVAASYSLGKVLGRASAKEKNPDGVVNMGIAGSYDCRGAPVGSLVLANGESFPEYGVWPEPDEKARERGVPVGEAGSPLPLRFPQAMLPSGPVFDHLALAPDIALGNMGLNCHSVFRQGVGVTVAGVSGTRRRARRMAAITGGLMENMEGFSLALGCLSLSLPFVEVRAISNAAGLRPPRSWNVPAALAAVSQAAYTLFAPWL